MDAKRYIRKHKENKPVLAICYDFDKTLSYTDMQAQGYIQSLGLEVEEFWKKSNQLAEDNDTQSINAIDFFSLFLMISFLTQIYIKSINCRHCFSQFFTGKVCRFFFLYYILQI